MKSVLEMSQVHDDYSCGQTVMDVTKTSLTHHETTVNQLVGDI